MKRRRVLELWNSYRAIVVPPTASHDELVKTRRAFMSGAQYAIHLVVDEVIKDPGNMEEHTKLLTDLFDELSTFAQSVLEGAA